MAELRTENDICNFDLFVSGEKKGTISLHVPVVDICAWHGNRPSPFEVVLGMSKEQVSRIIYITDGLDPKTGEIVPVIEDPDCILGAEALQRLIDKAGMDSMLKEARERERLCMAQLEFLMADMEEEEMTVTEVDDDDDNDDPEVEPEQVTIIKSLQNARRIIDAVLYLKTDTWKIKTIKVLPAHLSGILQKASDVLPYGILDDIHSLYEHVILQNERLNKLTNLHAPAIIIRHEILHLQKAVDYLYANERLDAPYRHIDGTPYMSLGSAMDHGIARF